MRGAPERTPKKGTPHLGDGMESDVRIGIRRWLASAAMAMA